MSHFFFWWIVELFSTENFTWRLDIVQISFWILTKYLGSKCGNTSNTTDTPRLKCVDFSYKQYIILEYANIFSQNVMHEDLI